MNNNKALLYQVCNLSEITKVIIPHFEKYPLITQKQSDYLLFKEIVKLMDKGEHLTKDGLIKIANLKASLNKGLSNELKVFFPEVIAITRPKIDLPINIDYNWIGGFFTGEGCFSVNIYKPAYNSFCDKILLRVIIAKHYRDKLLIEKLMNTLDCGVISKNSDAVVLTISRFKDIHSKITPLFNEYLIQGVKSLDFCKIAKLVSEKTLTLVSLEKIHEIKLNKGRYKGKVAIGKVRYLLNIVYCYT